MFRKKLTAIITAGLILGNSIPVFAQPETVYLKSKDNKTIYINYNDYVKGYASKNKDFMNILKDHDIKAISVKTSNSEKVIDFDSYSEDYNNKNVTNVDGYSDKEDSKEYELPEKVKELSKNGTISSEEVTPPDKEQDEKDFISIAAARKTTIGENVTVKGLVTSVIGNNVFIQDETAGIYIYLGPTINENLVVGNKVKITGVINAYGGLIQIKSPTEVTLESANNTLPELKTVTVSDIKDNHQGMRVLIKNVTINSIGNPDKHGGYTVTAYDKTGSIDIRIDGHLVPKIESSKFKIGSIIDVIACLSKFNSSNQLMISKISDIKVIKEGSGEVPSIDKMTISQIQGKSHNSPLKDRKVSNVRGIVTAVSALDKYQKGFFMQNPNPDNDSATSEGIFVKCSDYSSLDPGDEVSVDGTVKEIMNGIFKGSVTETVLQASKVTKNSDSNKLPEPIVIKLNENLAKNIDNDNLTSFDIDEDAIDYYESLEGMLVQVNDPQIVGADERYGEICVLANNGEFSEDQRTKYNGIKAYKDDFNPEIITIDDVLKPIVNNKEKKYIDDKFEVSIGDKFTDSIVGVMSSGFGKYKVLNTKTLPEIQPGNYDKVNKEVTSLEKNDNKLTIASFNVENLSKYEKEKLNNIGKAIVNNLKSPDILGLSEILDNNGVTNSNVTDASETYEALIDAIKVAGGPNYAYTDIAPVANQDGGIPGGNIRVGFIYNKARLHFVNKAKGDATTAVTMTDNGLSVNPGRISPKDSAFNSSRKPLVGQFRFNGKDVFIIANHLNSKRGDGPLFGTVQPPIRGSENQRHRQATLVNNFIKEILNKKPDANVVALGDMNDYEFSETLGILKGNEMTNMIETLPENERYSYVYCGNSQVLDNILVSKNLSDKTDIDVVHINSQSTYEKLSDHDPALIQIDLGPAIVLSAKESVTKAASELSLGDINNIKSNLTLPTEGSYGTTIEWKSDRPEIVSNTGVVVRPKDDNVKVTLTATISKVEESSEKSFELTVIKEDSSSQDTDKFINEGFDDGCDTEGWEISNKGKKSKYESDGNFGKKSPSLKLAKNGHYVISPKFNYSAKELSFWIKGNGTSNVSVIKIEGLINDIWTEIETIDNLPTKGQTRTVVLPENVKQIKFTYIKDEGNVALDDVVIR